MFMSQASTENLIASAPRNGIGNHNRETFHKFFECWITEQNQHLHELIAASKNHERCTEAAEAAAALEPLIDRVLCHYEAYYQAKSHSANHDVLAMFSASWRSSLEGAFLWIGGWRPSMAFHLLYSKSGLQVEAQLAVLLQGLSTGDLADLSPDQLTKVDELQKKSIRKEKAITEKMAKHQETVADTSMVDLSHVLTEILQNDDGGDSAAENLREGIEHQVEETLASKEEGLEEMLKRADELRLSTLREIVNILTPIQAVHFLIAAAELHLRLHEWGKRRDAAAAAAALRGGTNQSN